MCRSSVILAVASIFCENSLLQFGPVCSVDAGHPIFWLLVPVVLSSDKKNTMLSSRCAQGDNKFSECMPVGA